MNQVRSERFQVESCRFQIMVELIIHEYSSRAVAMPAPVSVIAILLMLAVPVVVVIVPVDVKSGAVLSIRLTSAVVLPVLPARSSKVNTNVQLPVNVYHVAFCPVSVSDQLSIVMTLPLVRLQETGIYSIVAVGGVVSGILMVNDAPLVLPTISVTIRT